MSDELEPISKRIPVKNHRLFIDELFKRNMNQTAAYMAAYPDSSYDAARSSAADLLAKPNLAAEVERRLKEKAMRADEVLARLADMARASIEDFVTFEDGIKMPFLDLAKAKEAGLLHLVKKIKYNSDGKIEFELHDAQSALDKLGKWHKLFTDVTDHNINGTVELDPLLSKALSRIYGDNSDDRTE